MPSGVAGRRNLQAVFLQPRAIDFEELDVDDDFRPRLVDGADDAAGGGDPLGRVLDRDRVGCGHLRDPARIDHDAEDVDRFLEIGVAQIERADDFVLVLAPLGRRVGNDGDRPLTVRPPEVARGAGDRRQRFGELRPCAGRW